MGKTILSVFFGLAIIVAGASGAFALQSGGVEIGDLETGSVAGQPFKELDVDAEFTAMEIGGKKVWYPPTTIINLSNRRPAPLLLKVTNNTNADHGFNLVSSQGYTTAPSSLKAELVLKPGETKFIGIPTSDLTYVTASGLLEYKCHLHPAHVGGQLLIQK